MRATFRAGSSTINLPDASSPMAGNVNRSKERDRPYLMLEKWGSGGRNSLRRRVARTGSADDRLEPRERLELLCDRGTVQVIRSVVKSDRLGPKAQEGDGVIAAWGAVAGRPVFCFAE